MALGYVALAVIFMACAKLVTVSAADRALDRHLADAHGEHVVA